MNNKSAEIKTKREKKYCEMSRYEKIARVVDTSPDVVRSYLSGYRNQDSPTGTRIMVADQLIEEGENLLIQRVKQIVHL